MSNGTDVSVKLLVACQSPLWPSSDICNGNGLCDLFRGRCSCSQYWSGNGDLIGYPFNDCFVFEPIITAVWAITAVLTGYAAFMCAVAIYNRYKAAKVPLMQIPGVGPLASFGVGSLFRFVLCVLKLASPNDRLTIGHDNSATAMYFLGSEFFWRGFLGFVRLLVSTSQSMAKMSGNQAALASAKHARNTSAAVQDAPPVETTTRDVDENAKNEQFLVKLDRALMICEVLSISSLVILFIIAVLPLQQQEVTIAHFSLKFLSTIFMYYTLGLVIPVLQEGIDKIKQTENDKLNRATAALAHSGASAAALAAATKDIEEKKLRAEKKLHLASDNFETFDSQRKKLRSQLLQCVLQIAWAYVRTLASYTLPLLICLSSVGIRSQINAMLLLDEAAATTTTDKSTVDQTNNYNSKIDATNVNNLVKVDTPNLHASRHGSQNESTVITVTAVETRDVTNARGFNTVGE